MTTSFLIELTVLILAIFLGFEVISKVPAMLHTPLMSGTNFIHGIVVVGALVVEVRSGITAVNSHPGSAGLPASEPPSASARSRRERRPNPSRGSRCPIPLSRMAIRTFPGSSAISTSTRVAWA